MLVFIAVFWVLEVFFLIKSDIRKLYKQKRSVLTLNQVEKMSSEIQKNILSLPQYEVCKNLFIFVNYGNEVVTRGIINDALSKDKGVAVPYMTGKPHEMVFLKIDGTDNLVENKYGILEPIFDRKNIVNSDKNTFIIVPALVLDSNKNRMGYGGGYYDKYLSENEYLCSVGVAYDFQMTENVPTDENDVTLDIVVTNKEIII